MIYVDRETGSMGLNSMGSGQRPEAGGQRPETGQSMDKAVAALTVPTAEEGSRCGWSRTADGP